MKERVGRCLSALFGSKVDSSYLYSCTNAIQPYSWNHGCSAARQIPVGKMSHSTWSRYLDFFSFGKAYPDPQTSDVCIDLLKESTNLRPEEIKKIVNNVETLAFTTFGQVRKF